MEASTSYGDILIHTRRCKRSEVTDDISIYSNPSSKMWYSEGFEDQLDSAKPGLTAPLATVIPVDKIAVTQDETLVWSFLVRPKNVINNELFGFVTLVSF